MLSLAPRIGAVALGLAAVSVAAFICQSAASAYVAQRGGEQRALASGLYLSFYYLGGGLGALLPGYAWELGRWPACVALFLILQWGISQGGAHLAQQGNA